MLRDSEAGTMKIAAKDITYANGIVISLDGQWLFVASSTTGTVLVYKRDVEKGTLKLAQRLQVYLIADNLSIDTETGYVYAIGFTSYIDAFKMVAFRDDFSAKRVGVARIIPNSGEELFYGRPFKVENVFYTTDPLFASATSIAVDSMNGRTFFGGLFTPGIVVCEGIL
ncbi:hypothetical protein BDR26DRAFT_871234 [Obelidium mucronatum]|nr:hypothetical protein BDR26DRAFT_871234 [Obelidium mucronatum]